MWSYFIKQEYGLLSCLKGYLSFLLLYLVVLRWLGNEIIMQVQAVSGT